MLLTRDTLRRIREGTVTLAFRRWKRPTVKTGGTLLTPIGQLHIESVEPVDPTRITRAEAGAAGFADLDALQAELRRRSAGDVYRIRLSRVGSDPRRALREAIPRGPELDQVVQRLTRLDARSSVGPWTARCLEVIADRPGERAAELARTVGMDTLDFKTRIRKLKALGLTESLPVGYRLSPRGRAVRRRVGPPLRRARVQELRGRR